VLQGHHDSDYMTKENPYTGITDRMRHTYRELAPLTKEDILDT